MKKHWLVIIGLVLVGCTTTHIKFDEDPQIFRGVWKGTAYQYLNMAIPMMSLDNSLILWRQHQQLKILDSSTGQAVKSVSNDPSANQIVAFGSDNKSLIERTYLSTGSYAIQIRDISTWQVVRTIPLPGSQSGGFVSVDARWLLDTEANTAKVISLESGQTIKTIALSSTDYVGLSPHGKYIVVAKYANYRVYAYEIGSVEQGKFLSLKMPDNPGCLLPGSNTPMFLGNPQLFFSNDESKMAVVLDGARLLVLDTQQANLISDTSNPTCGTTLFPTLNNDGSGSFVVSRYASSGKSYQVAWDTAGKFTTQDISDLIGLNQISAVLTSGSAYLIYSQPLPYEVRLARVGTSAWQNNYSSKIADLSFDMQATKIDTGNYKATGTAQMDGKTFSVTAVGYGSVTFTSVHVQTPPAMLMIDANLESTTGDKYHLYVTKGPESLLPGSKVRYDGFLDSTTAQPRSGSFLILER